MKNILLFLLFCWLCGCNNSAAPTDTVQAGSQFHTTPPARLYFKNMRSFYYEQTTESGTKIDFYKLKRLRENRAHPILIPIIADNWLKDEVYILLEVNNITLTDTLHVKLDDGTSSATTSLVGFDPKIHYRLANQLAEGLKKGHKINVITHNGVWRPLFEESAEKANFLTVFHDYKQLTEFNTK